MNAVCIIPARYAAQRFPGKPLVRETGKFLIQHVYENAARARCFSQVIVATDDHRIAEAVESFGGRVAMTRDDHPSGTDRIAEVAEGLEADLVVNVQGDEPDVGPELLELLVRHMAERPDVPMGTLATPCRSVDEVLSPNLVKVVVDGSGRALYFSRSPIPFNRAAFLAGHDPPPGDYLHHLGIYAFRRESLLRFPALPRTPLEQLEALEQLRALEHGWSILVAEIDYHGRGIDTPEDYAAFVASRKWKPSP